MPLVNVLAERFVNDTVSPALLAFIIMSEVPVTTSVKSIASPLSWLLTNVASRPEPENCIVSISSKLLLEMFVKSVDDAIDIMSVPPLDASTNIATSINGLQGTDTLIGGNGADTFDGGSGADTMTGNNGADIFKWISSGDTDSGLTESTADKITDFVSGTSKLHGVSSHP